MVMNMVMDMVYMDMVDMDMVVMDMVDMDMVDMDMMYMDMVDMNMVDMNMVDMEMVDIDMVDQHNVTQSNLSHSWIRWTTGHRHSGPRKRSIVMVQNWVRHAKCTWSSFTLIVITSHLLVLTCLVLSTCFIAWIREWWWE